MASKKPRRVREQVVVYLNAGDRALLEEMAEKTQLARTELLRRGLRRLANETLTEQKPWSSFDDLVGALDGADLPSDLSARPDYYLYGGGYGRPRDRKKKRAGPR